MGSGSGESRVEGNTAVAAQPAGSCLCTETCSLAPLH